MKKILFVLCLSVILTMTGIAAADSMNIVKDGTNEDVSQVKLGVGDTVTLDINISSFLAPINYDHGIFVALVDLSFNPINGLQVEINETTGPFGIKPDGIWNTLTDNPVIIWKQDMNQGGFEKFDLKITKTAEIPEGSQLLIFDGVSYQGNLVLLSADNVEVNVPEFSTIAIPIVSVIGMLFILQNKKKRT